MLPIFIDLEASSLSETSFPIEIAWSDSDGAVRAYLIRPECDWNDWDPNSESMHGLSREEITSKGLPADWLARELNAALRGTVAHSDAPEYDLFWLQRLFEASSVDMAFELRHFDSLFPQTSPDRIAAQAELARCSTPGRQHRAGCDVKFLIELYRLLRAE